MFKGLWVIAASERSRTHSSYVEGGYLVVSGLFGGRVLVPRMFEGYSVEHIAKLPFHLAQQYPSTTQLTFVAIALAAYAHITASPSRHAVHSPGSLMSPPSATNAPPDPCHMSQFPPPPLYQRSHAFPRSLIRPVKSSRRAATTFNGRTIPLPRAGSEGSKWF